MRLLLDTHILLWWLADDPSLPNGAKAAIGSASSAVFVSAATVWEIAVNCALRKLEFPVARIAEILAAEGFEPLAIETHHAVGAGALPPCHDDPFDRMLVAQALHEPLRLLTADTALYAYSDTIIQI